MQIGSPFLLGVNYWPRKKAMFMWQDFDAGEIREEFAMIRALGLTHVRIFLLWESFQPTPTAISMNTLADLVTTADIAANLGLKLEPTFFTGHMSGPNWAPDWLISPQARREGERSLVSLNRFTPSPNRIFNIYTEPFVLAAEKLQLTTICRALKDHPAIFAWSLGNEPDLFCLPPSGADAPVGDSRPPDIIGRDWIRTMTAIIKEADPNHLVTIGFHTKSIDSNCGLRADHATESTDFSVMHGYSIYHPIARRPLDPDFVPFTAALTAALAGRPVLYEEFGLCTWAGTGQPDQPSGTLEMPFPFGKKHRQFFASDQDAADYYAQVLPRLLRVGSLGAFAWCFGDYDSVVWQKPPCDVVIHERAFGLFRADGTLKPAALAVQKFAATRPVVQAAQRRIALAYSGDAYYQNAWKHMGALYREFEPLD